MDETAVIAGLRQALAHDPSNGALWRHLARLLLAAGALDEARAAYARGRAAEPDRRDPVLDAVVAGPDGRGDGTERPWRPAPAPDRNEPRDPEGHGMPVEAVTPGGEVAAWAGRSAWGAERLTFADVAGLEDVKRQITLRMLAPAKHAELFRAFQRGGGGGLLLYGPPGCGKTLVARATAGEMGGRFIAAAIHEILDRWWGESEKAIHALFAEARRARPCVLFFDEFDALSAGRGADESQHWTSLADQLLQEMDGIGGRNDDVLVFAATNAPWTVDAAFRRPGRFDRLCFVPPPDAAARTAILRRRLGPLPGGAAIPVGPLARQTAGFTGADLDALCERAAEHALARSLAAGAVRPVTRADLARERRAMQSSATEWLETARARLRRPVAGTEALAAYLRGPSPR